jgi:hypothetical protein
MRLVWLAALAAIVLFVHASGQQLSTKSRAISESARARYYHLETRGFKSLTCSVKFDFARMKGIPSGVTNKLVEATEFTLTLDRKGGPAVRHHYSREVGEDEKQELSQLTPLLASFVMGLFQTWPTKGLHGPIPPFDSQIESVIARQDGYAFSLRVPGSPVQIRTDMDYVVTEVISAGGKIKEHPVYTPSPEGLIFTGLHAVDSSDPDNPVEVRYELGTAVVDGMRVPISARLRVNQNVDVRFSLSKCSIEKEEVLLISPLSSH